MSEYETGQSYSSEPRSRAWADLGGGINLYYQTGSLTPVTTEAPRVPSQREQLQNARRAEQASNDHKHPLSPSPALADMTPEQRAANLEQIRAIRDGHLAVAEQVQIVEPTNEQLTLDV